MPATHSVVYNGSIDLMDFVETHFDYTTFAQYGKSAKDQVMSDDLMEQLNLHYEFTIVDYLIGAETTSESAHITQHDGKAPGSKFIPRSVGEDGKTITDEPATMEAVDREPLIRVDLVHGTGDAAEIVRYGYIKLRIVKDELTLNDLETTINLNEVWMNCGDEAKMTWSQIENKILKQLNNQAGMTKKDFEKNYKLDVYGDYEFMPYNDHTKINGNHDENGKLYTTSWQAKRYVKGAKGYIPAIDGDKVKCDDDSVKFWSEANNHFGEVWYTPHDNSTEGHEWDEQTNVLIWNFYQGKESIANMVEYRNNHAGDANLTKEQAGGMNRDKYHAMREVLGADYDHQGTSQKALSTVVRFINKNTGTSIWVTLVIPAEKLHFEYGSISNKDWTHWWKINTQTAGVLQTTAPYWDEFDTHMNTPVPAFTGYKVLTADQFTQDLRDYWDEPAKMVKLLGTAAKFTKFYSDATKGDAGIDDLPDDAADPVITYTFTYPVDELNSDGTSAGEKTLKKSTGIVESKFTKAWDVKGASGTVWTLTLNDDGNKILAVGKNGFHYPHATIDAESGTVGDDHQTKYEVVASLNNAAGDTHQSLLKYNGVELRTDATQLYPAATDLLNKSGRYDETGAKRFGAGSAMGEQADVEYLAKNIDETFTAYIKVNVTHGCYDPLISRQYFNVRVLRPINVAGKEVKRKDIPNIMQKISLRELVDIVDYRDIPVVGRLAGAQKAADNAFGIAAPAWTDVIGMNGQNPNLEMVAQQNKGLPYEYYGIKDLAVVYSEILSDHMAPKAFREAGALRTGSAIAAAVEDGYIKAVKNIQSMTGNLLEPADAKVLTLYKNDDVNSLKVADSWPAAQIVSFTDENAFSTGIGKIEYTNNSGIAQLFHIYVPIAIHYNWGNVKWGNDATTADHKKYLDNNYTQVVWGVITIDPSYQPAE
jgi:hypothetical protein